MGLDLFHFVPAIKSSVDEVLDFFEITELSDNPDYLQRNKKFIVEEDFEELGFLKVIYVRDIGYQRKGVNQNFYKDFEDSKPYFDLPSVKRAYSYLKQDHISTLAHLQQNFQANFIDNFVEGASILYASW